MALTSGAWIWEHFLGFFAARGYPAYAVSLRGHGGSEGDLAVASFEDYVDDVETAAKAIGSEPVLVGHSMGGLVDSALSGPRRQGDGDGGSRLRASLGTALLGRPYDDVCAGRPFSAFPAAESWTEMGRAGRHRPGPFFEQVSA